MAYYPSPPDKDPEQHSILNSSRARLAVLCVSVLLIVTGAAMLIRYGVELAASRQTTQELREAAAATEEPTAELTEQPALNPTVTIQPTATPAPAVTESAAETVTPRPVTLPEVPYPDGYKLNARIQKLRKKSEYIIGWITMDDLDEPVVLKDNTFFLNHDATGKRNSNGAIFMDEGTGLLSRPYTILLYGHNMKSGAMFGNLRKYEQFAFFDKHRIFRFDTLYEEGSYVIFTVATIHLTPGRSRYLNLAALQSMNRDTRRQAIETLESLSLHAGALDVNEEDQVLLLVTCVGDDDERLVVAARRLREGEREDSLVMKSR